MARKNSIKGFTLAEILITLVIIGVVATITLPIIQNNIQDTELKTGFKKMYSVLNNAYKNVVTENGNTPYDCYYDQVNSYVKSDCSIFWTELKKQFNIIKEYSGAVDGVNIPNYTGTDLIAAAGGSVNTNCAGGKTANKINKDIWILEDGSSIISYENHFGTSSDGSTLLIADTNGIKKPNKWGYDLFILNFYKKKSSSSIVINDSICYPKEKDGYSFDDMLLK